MPSKMRHGNQIIVVATRNLPGGHRLLYKRVTVRRWSGEETYTLR